MEIWKAFQDTENGELTLNQYQVLAQRTSATDNKRDKMVNGLLGLNGEAGEAIDILKKYWYQGHDLDEDKLLDEASDILWYLAELCTGLGISMDELARYNVGKLYKRYPEGFDSDKSVNREV